MFGNPRGLESSALTWARARTHRYLAAPPTPHCPAGEPAPTPQRDRCPQAAHRDRMGQKVLGGSFWGFHLIHLKDGQNHNTDLSLRKRRGEPGFNQLSSLMT